MTQKERGFVSFFSERERIPSGPWKVNVHSVIEDRCVTYANGNGVWFSLRDERKCRECVGVRFAFSVTVCYF